MRTPRTIETNAFDVRKLDQEHAEIRRRYTGLEKAILRGREMSGILEAANSLVQMMLLHFAHEEQLLLKLSFSSHLRKKLNDANMEVTDQLIGIAEGLEEGKAAAVFHLLRLGRFWMKEHMHLESVESLCWLPVEFNNRGCRALSSELKLPRSVCSATK
jgi:hemerythrin